MHLITYNKLINNKNLPKGSYSNALFGIKLISLLLLLTYSLLAQNYLWPTNASNYLTSSFCEYRPGHYHSAIDIKTWNQEGYPVYAVDDAEIYRILVSPFGYGKGLYLRLKDGNFAVYGHLQKFTPKINQIIRQKQLQNKKYRLIWYPKNWKLKKGEIIAYTGSTGIGTPHLHFEIRNPKEQPLNPLAFYPEVKDNIRPILQKIAIIPLSCNGTINQSFLPQIFDLTYIKDGVYVIKSPLRASGKIGLAIKGFDRADGVYNKIAFYQTTMSVDGEDVFQITYNKMDFASTSYIKTEIYYPLQAKSKEVFHKLYIEPFNILPFYKHFSHTDGTIVVKDKPISFNITVSDFHGNNSMIIGELLPEHDDDIDITQQYYKQGWAYLNFNLKSFNFLSFSSSSDLTNWKELSYFEFLDRKFEPPRYTLLTKVKIPDPDDQYLRIETQSNDGRKINRLISLVAKDTFPAPTLYFSDKKLVLESSLLDVKFIAKNDAGTKVLTTRQDSDGISHTAIPIRKFAHPDFEIGFNSADTIIWFDQLNVALFVPNYGQTSTWFDSNLVMTSYPNSFFDTTLVQVNIFEPDTINFELPVKRNIYEILPDDIALLRGVSIFIKTDSLNSNNKWGIYELKENGKISFVSANFDSVKNRFFFRTKSFGKFIIAQDTAAPTLEIQSPVANRYYNSNPKILFATDDELTGIDHEENISITVDSLYVLPEWDPEEKSVYARIDATLSSGEHEIIIEVKDQVGNTTIQRRKFIIE